MIQKNIVRTVLAAFSLIVTVGVNAETRVSGLQQGVRDLTNFENLRLTDSGTVIGNRKGEIYAIQPGEPEKLIHTVFPEHCVADPAPCPDYPIIIQQLYAAGDYVFIRSNTGNESKRFKISDPTDIVDVEVQGGIPMGMSNNGCLFGVVGGSPGLKGAMWCDDLSTLFVAGASQNNEWSRLTAFNSELGLTGVTAGTIDTLTTGNSTQYFYRTGQAFVESLADGSRMQLTFGDDDRDFFRLVLAVKSTAFNADRPGAFTAVVLDAETKSLWLKIWNADRAPDSSRWVGETILLGTNVDTGRSSWPLKTGLVRLTDRFVVFDTDTDGCEVLSFSGSRTILRGRSPDGGTSIKCSGAREGAASLEVLLGAMAYDFPVVRTEISDVTLEQRERMVTKVRQCTERRLQKRADFERAERTANKKWDEINLPVGAKTCRERMANRFAVTRRVLRRYVNELSYDGIGGDNAAWLLAVPESMRSAIGSLESCVGTFASTDERLIWRCAKQIGRDESSGIGALDSYDLFKQVAANGVPKSY